MKRIIPSVLVAALLPLTGIAATYNFVTTNSALADMPHGTAVTWGLSNSAGSSQSDSPTNTNGTGINSSLNSYTNLLNDINNSGKIVTSATLTLWDIYDWTGETTDPADALFVNILGGLDSGIKSKSFASGTAPSNSWSLAINPFVDSPSTNNDFNDKLQAPTALKFNEADAANAGSLLRATRDATTKSGTPNHVTWSDPSGGSGSPDFNLVINLTGANLAFLTTLLDTDLNNTSPNIGFGFAAECHYYMDGITLTLTTGSKPTTHSVPDAGSTLALMGLGMAVLMGSRRFKK